jgi:hypothetical protein
MQGLLCYVSWMHAVLSQLLLLLLATQVTSFQALVAALQHPAITGDVKTVSSMLQTCKSWRTALQQCKAGNLTVSLPTRGAAAAAPPSNVQSTQQIACFAGWLPQHAGLISGISLQEPRGEYEQRAAYCDIAEQLLVLSLKEAAAYGRPAAAAAAAAAELQLASFASNIIRSPALLHALPAAALTQLVLSHSGSWRDGFNYNSGGFTAGLARLTALRELQLHRGWMGVGDPCLAAIGQLTNLTRVTLDISTAWVL